MFFTWETNHKKGKKEKNMKKKLFAVLLTIVSVIALTGCWVGEVGVTTVFDNKAGAGTRTYILDVMDDTLSSTPITNPDRPRRVRRQRRGHQLHPTSKAESPRFKLGWKPMHQLRDGRPDEDGRRLSPAVHDQFSASKTLMTSRHKYQQTRRQLRTPCLGPTSTPRNCRHGNAKGRLAPSPISKSDCP